MAMYPNVYADLSALSAPFVVPRAGYLRYLRELVESGYGNRLMFGSDFPSEAERGVQIIRQAEFLTAEQKSDILCGNAARFLKLDSAICLAEEPKAGSPGK